MSRSKDVGVRVERVWLPLGMTGCLSTLSALRFFNSDRQRGGRGNDDRRFSQRPLVFGLTWDDATFSFARTMAPVTVDQLQALLSSHARVVSSDSQQTRRVPPRYTGRRGWSPASHADFGDGGAFPEIDLVQMPCGLGWDTKRFPNVQPLAVLDCGFAELQTRAARCMLRSRTSERNVAPRRATPEYDTFVAFLRDVREKHLDCGKNVEESFDDAFADAVLDRFLSAHKNARAIARVENVDPSSVSATYLGAVDGIGEPVLVKDGGREWTRSETWTTLDGLRSSPLGERMARCNDRAPARHADANEDASLIPGAEVHGTKQRTCELPFREFLEYVLKRPSLRLTRSNALDELAKADAPFYCNGWRAFERSDGFIRDAHINRASFDGTIETATEAFPQPYFMDRADTTRAIATQARLAFMEKMYPPGQDRAASARLAADALDASLWKLFVGPTGTITRMHQDAGDAHGWLGQVTGRKLFILCPPSDAPYLRKIPGEKETSQSFVDPLDFLGDDREGRAKNALFWEEASPVVCILHPGEIVLIPRGWWHYAASLDPSVTAMKNFYDVDTNVASLVRILAGRK